MTLLYHALKECVVGLKENGLFMSCIFLGMWQLFCCKNSITCRTQTWIDLTKNKNKNSVLNSQLVEFVQIKIKKQESNFVIFLFQSLKRYRKLYVEDIKLFSI